MLRLISVSTQEVRPGTPTETNPAERMLRRVFLHYFMTLYYHKSGKKSSLVKISLRVYLIYEVM